MRPTAPDGFEQLRAEAVLAVVDHAMLLAVPLLVATVAIARPAQVMATAPAGVAAFLLTVVLVLLGRRRQALWRGAVYTAVTLVVAIVSLWTIGPLTGVGVLFGVAMLFAGAFLTRRWLVIAFVLASAAIIARAMVGLGDIFPGWRGRFVVPASLWFGTSIAAALLLWIATRVLTALVASLEQSYELAAGAYERETSAREALDESRRDLDELAQVELLGRLAGGVAHDVNNALSPIVFAADLLESEVETPEQRRHLAELEAATHHVADLVRDLLWIGRKFPSPSASVAELGTTVRACLERIARVARKLAVEVRIDPALRVAIAPEHLEQLMFGLLLGGYRAGIRRAQLTSEVDGDVAVIGLAGLERSATESRSRDMQIQLGVAAARDLLQQVGGTLETTEHEGLLQVRIRLSLAAERRSMLSIVAPRRALVVEDEPMVLRRLCQLIARLGYEVRAATTVAEAMASLDTEPDLLVTDLQLPDGSGEDIAIAAYQRRPARPIIICSGFRSNELSGELPRLAPITFLAKPFTTAELNAAVAASAKAAVA